MLSGRWLNGQIRTSMPITWIYCIRDVRTCIHCVFNLGSTAFPLFFCAYLFLVHFSLTQLAAVVATPLDHELTRHTPYPARLTNQYSVVPRLNSALLDSVHNHTRFIGSFSPSLFTNELPPVRRTRRSYPVYSPPRILPDLPNLVRFFDRTGLHIRCRAAGHPSPAVRWFYLPATGAARPAPSGPSTDRSTHSDNSPRSTASPLHGVSDFQMDENYANALGLNNYVREAPQSDEGTAIEITATTPSGRSFRSDSEPSDKTKPNTSPIVVGDGWLNFTAMQSSTMRMIFFCQAENYLGRSRSRKMVVHQVPMPDENLRIIYTTFPIEPGQKAVVSCQPEQGIFNRFLKVNYWEVYLNNTLLSTVDRSYGRFSMINITKHPELHIRSVTESELTDMEVRCVLQSIVDEAVKVERPERGRLQRLQFGFSYTELRSIGAELDVLRGTTIELPWAVEGELRVAVDWFYVNDASRIRQAIALDSSAISSDTTDATVSARLNTGVGSTRARFLPWGTEYELVDGAYGNLRLINLSVADSGHYIAESAQPARSLHVKYVVRVRAPLGVKITPNQRTVDWGSRVELTCEITGYPRQLVYWLHNARPVPRRHHVRGLGPSIPPSERSGGIRIPAHSLSERLIIKAFSMEDVGVYHCIAENGRSAERLTLGGHSTPPDTAARTAASLNKVTESNAEELPHSVSATLTGGESVDNLMDNAQATAVLTMGKMRPFLTWQNPSVESGSVAAQVLLSIHSGVTDSTLECRFAANPVPQIVWYRDDQPVPLDESGVISPAVFADNTTAYTTITRLTVDIRRVPDLEDLWTSGGEYRAVAKNAHGQADCRTYVLLETALRLRPMDTRKPAIAGRSYTLKCYFIGSGIPTLQWHRIRNGRDVQRIPVDHRHQLLEEGRVLRITEVNQEEDEADYRCTATHSDRTANITMSLKVSHAPRLFELPQTRQVKYARDMLSYSCALQNRADKPWYAWWEFQLEGTNAIIPLPPFKKNTYNGFSVSYVDDVASHTEDTPWRLPDSLRDKVPSFVHSEPNAAVHVTVNTLRKEQHHGNLTCVVLNDVGEDRRSIRVTFVPELAFAIRPPNNQDVTLGQTIAIDCAAKPSDLDPVVEWQYLQKTTGKYLSVSELSEATNGRIAQLENGTLLLSNVDESDPREFLCFLKPGRLSTAAERSSAVNLEVHVPARIDPIDHLEKVRGSRFNLTCSVHGDSEDLKADWYYRSAPHLRWQLIDKPCVVPAVVLDEARLREDGTLDPTKFDGPNSETRGVMTPSTHNSNQVTSLIDCQSYAMEGLESGVLFRQASFFKPNKRGLDKQLQFFSVKEAHMGEYMCRASNLYNRDTFGERTEVEEFVRLTVISVPGPVNIVYNSTQTTATTVSFAWLPPTQNGNKPVHKYRIRYSKSEAIKSELTKTHQQPNMTELEVNENTRRIELKGLRPYTMYRITVVAINDVGPSEESVLPLTTQEAKPSGPVLNLVANGTASDTIVVSWDDPAPEHLNGNVDRYWVCRQRVNDTFSPAELAHLAWPEAHNTDQMTSSGSTIRGRHGDISCAKLFRQRDYELTGLPKFTAYAFRVIALNSKGASPAAFTQARTLEDLPQAPPADVTCVSQQHSIAVSWNPPHPGTINGILTEYHVSYFAANVYGDETNSVNQAVKGQTTVTLAGLLAYTNYTIQVAVSNRKGRGPASPRLTCLTKEAPPTAPEYVKAKSVNSTCVIISWSHPRKPQGQTKYYCLDAIPISRATRDSRFDMNSNAPLERSRGPCVKPDFSSEYNYYTYCGLTEERAYNISVRATNQFEGHRTWTGPIRPAATPSMGIISIGGKINAQNKMRVTMDCLVIGGYQPSWTYPQGDLNGIHVFDNGTLQIDSVRTSHNGRYECSAVSDTIVYDLVVQEIMEEPPRKPIWRKFTPSLRGIQVEWLSPGSRRLDAPILWFYLNWTNAYTGTSETVQLPADQRTYYLSNLTCATTVRFQLCAANKVGNSSFTEVTSWTTLGSAPQAANAAQLIPTHLRHQTTVSFNLSSFLPGNGCPPLFYRLLIAPTEDGHFGLKQAVINRTLTRADLITLADGLNRERCCYNVTNLSSGAHYHYKVVAMNAAGSASVQGQFWTLTAFGREPALRQSHLVGQASLLQQPTVIVPITALFAIILVVLIALPFICRHRRLEENLRPIKKATECHNELRPGEESVNHTTESKHRVIPHNYHQYPTSRNSRSALPPIPGQTDSQSSTMVVSGRSNAGRTRGVSGWFAGTRARLYDRGRAGPDRTEHQHGPAPVHPVVDEDRLSTNSIDSEGNINPYATYAATGFPDLTGTIGTTNNGTVGMGNKLLSSGGVDGGSHLVDAGGVMRAMAQARDVRPYGPAQQCVAAIGSRMGTSWNTVLKRNPQLHPDTHMGLSGHHYHYPNLDTNMGPATTIRPRLLRVGSVSRLHPAQGFIDHRLLSPSSAALLDPLLTPYDNSTLGADDLEDELARVSLLRPVHGGLRRRVNSFESLHRLPNGVTRTYHRGRDLMPATILGPNGTLIPITGPMDVSAPFYDPRKPTDPIFAYRSSVLSSTTASSNQDELMQAYEYGRNHQSCLLSGSVMPIGATASGAGALKLATRPSDRTPTVVRPSFGVLATAEAEFMSGGSGSSDATDSGIRQFTQQPPQPDESRHAACEVPLMYDGTHGTPYRTGKFPLTRTAIPPGCHCPPPFSRTDMECPSDMTDTYASVDYNGRAYGAAMFSAAGVPPLGGRMNATQRALYGPSMIPISTRTRQPLPALPSSSIIAYNDNGSLCYGPVSTNRQVSCYPTSGTRRPAFTITNPAMGPGTAQVGSGQVVCRDDRRGKLIPRTSAIDRNGRPYADSQNPNLSAAPTRRAPGSIAIDNQAEPALNPGESEENVYTSEFVLV